MKTSPTDTFNVVLRALKSFCFSKQNLPLKLLELLRFNFSQEAVWSAETSAVFLVTSGCGVFY